MSCPFCGFPDGGPGAPCGCEALAPGTRVAGRYRIESIVGSGATGLVYRAWDTVVEELVALKVLRGQWARSSETARRFRAEIRLARRVTHEAVCRIHDYGEAEGLSYLSMELLEGGDLRRLLEARGPLAPADTAALGVRLAEGLAAIHAVGIIHRDVKPHNVLLDASGQAKLVDFGVARTADGRDRRRDGSTYVMGTPDYMSPEQRRGGPLDARSDLYSLAVVLYEAAVGIRPCRTHGPAGEDDDCITCTEARRRMPPALMRVLAGALAEDPDRRPPAARALAAELRDLAPRLAVESPAPVPTAPLSAANTVTMAQARSSAGAHQRPLSAWRLAALPVAVALLLGVPARLGREAERPVPGGVPLAAVGSAGLSPSTASRSNARSESGEPPPHVAAHPIRVRPVALQDIPSPPPSTDAADEVRRPPAEAAAEPRSGRLQIGARPWAHVLLDGVDVGSTPLALAVPAGTHRIRLVHPAYRPYARTLRLAPGETRRLYVDLRLDGVPRRPPPVE